MGVFADNLIKGNDIAKQSLTLKQEEKREKELLKYTKEYHKSLLKDFYIFALNNYNELNFDNKEYLKNNIDLFFQSIGCNEYNNNDYEIILLNYFKTIKKVKNDNRIFDNKKMIVKDTYKKELINCEIIIKLVEYVCIIAFITYIVLRI